MFLHDTAEDINDTFVILGMLPVAGLNMEKLPDYGDNAMFVEI